jgi:hypothetical protein
MYAYRATEVANTHCTGGNTQKPGPNTNYACPADGALNRRRNKKLTASDQPAGKKHTSSCTNGVLIKPRWHGGKIVIVA